MGVGDQIDVRRFPYRNGGRKERRNQEFTMYCGLEGKEKSSAFERRGRTAPETGCQDRIVQLIVRTRVVGKRGLLGPAVMDGERVEERGGKK